MQQEPTESWMWVGQVLPGGTQHRAMPNETQIPCRTPVACLAVTAHTKWTSWSHVFIANVSGGKAYATWIPLIEGFMRCMRIWMLDTEGTALLPGALPSESAFVQAIQRHGEDGRGWAVGLAGQAP